MSAIKKGKKKGRGVHGATTVKVTGRRSKNPLLHAVADELERHGAVVERPDDDEPKSPAPAKQKTFGFDNTHGFLGEEFLLWLWFQTEANGGEFLRTDRGFDVGVAIDDLLVFAPHGDDESEQTIRHGMPTRTAEARAGLRQGHRLAKAKLLVASGAKTWTLVLDGTRMVCSAVKLPEDAEECENAADRTFDRAASWFALHELVAGLFLEFLRVRRSPAWATKEAPAMAAWMRR